MTVVLEVINSRGANPQRRKRIPFGHLAVSAV
jgi:hypothetical protein